MTLHMYLDAAEQSALHAVGRALVGASGNHHLQGVKGQITKTTSKQNMAQDGLSRPLTMVY